MINNKLIPKRRFKAFKNNEAWEQRKFKNILDPENGIRRGPFGSALKKEFFVPKSDYVVYEQQNAINDHYKTRYYISKEKYEELIRFKVNAGDFIMSGAGTIGSISIVPKGIKLGVFNQALIRIKINNDILESDFFLQWMRSDKMQKRLTEANPASAMANLVPMVEIKEWEVLIPGKKEQGVIGEFFKQLDNLIALHQRKLKKLKELKLAYLSEMFPEEGEKYPKRRFAGFTDPWEQRKLSEIADIVGGGTPSTNNPEYWEGDIDWYAPAEMEGQRYAVGSVKKITELGLQKSSATMLPAGRTVLFTSRAGIGKMAILQRSAATNQGFQSIVLKDGYNPYFIYSLGSKIKELAEGVASGSTFLEISGKMLGNLVIAVSSTAEQDKIASCFQRLDDLITLHQLKLEKLENIKKAYLNEMFV